MQAADPASAPKRPPAIIDTLDPYTLFGFDNVTASPYVPQNGKEWTNIVREFSPPPDLSRLLRRPWAKPAQPRPTGAASHITKED
jgi:hypothetical protein